MPELWILLTALAAFSQNIRSALQKHLTATLSTLGATYVRFLFAAPFAVLFVIALRIGTGAALPQPGPTFYGYAIAGSLAQVVATALLVSLFSYRNFFVGTAFSKTETLQAALLGLVILADELSVGAIIGIGIGIAGVVTIAAAKSHPSLRSVMQSLTSRTSVIGLLIGFCFGVTAICFRGASISLTGGFLIQAVVTLAFVLVLQTLVVTVYLLLREPGQLRAVLASWRLAWLVGLSGMLASVGWFSAMTLQNAAYVRAVGQIELVFAFLASTLLFRERTTRVELLGVALIVGGIVVLLLYR